LFNTSGTHHPFLACWTTFQPPFMHTNDTHELHLHASNEPKHLHVNISSHLAPRHTHSGTNPRMSATYTRMPQHRRCISHRLAHVRACPRTPETCSRPRPSLASPWLLSVHGCAPSRTPAPRPAPSSAPRLACALMPCPLVHAVYRPRRPSTAARPRLRLRKLAPPSHPHDHLHPSSPARTPFERTIFERIYASRREWHPLGLTQPRLLSAALSPLGPIPMHASSPRTPASRLGHSNPDLPHSDPSAHARARSRTPSPRPEPSCTPLPRPAPSHNDPRPRPRLMRPHASPTPSSTAAHARAVRPWLRVLVHARATPLVHASRRMRPRASPAPSSRMCVARPTPRALVHAVCGPRRLSAAAHSCPRLRPWLRMPAHARALVYPTPASSSTSHAPSRTPAHSRALVSTMLVHSSITRLPHTFVHGSARPRTPAHARALSYASPAPSSTSHARSRTPAPSSTSSPGPCPHPRCLCPFRASAQARIVSCRPSPHPCISPTHFFYLVIVPSNFSPHWSLLFSHHHAVSTVFQHAHPQI